MRRHWRHRPRAFARREDAGLHLLLAERTGAVRLADQWQPPATTHAVLAQRRRPRPSAHAEWSGARNAPAPAETALRAKERSPSRHSWRRIERSVVVNAGRGAYSPDGDLPLNTESAPVLLYFNGEE